MAITYTDNGGGAPNGSDKEFTYTFPVIQTEDVKVALNGVTQATTKYTVDNVSNPTKITFNTTNPTSGLQVTSGTNQGAPLTGVRVRVYRETTVGKANGDEDPKAVFAAGSSIRAIDLNANQEQALMAIQELQDRPIETEDIQNDAITGDKIADDQINSEHYVAGSIDLEHMSANSVDSDQYVDGSIDGVHIANDQIDSQHYAAGSIDLEHMSANSVDSDQYVDGSIDHVHLANDVIDGDNIQDDVINSEHYVALSIDTEHIANENVTTAKLAPDAVTSAKLADNAVDSEHYVDGSIDHVHLANDAVDGDNIADDSINSEHYVDGSIDTQHIADSQITTVKIAADAVNGTKIADDSIDSEHYVDGSIDEAHIANDAITTSKIADGAITDAKIQGGSLDNRYYTKTLSDARYFNVNTGDTIKDGDTFPDNDTTIATTAAINDRIIDLVDDVGGFVPIANETSFPTANPDVNGGAGTIVSVKAASTNLTAQSGTTLTIANGRGTGNAVIITGVSATIPSGFGFLVETTTTDHTYAFHRLVPKATEVTTVAGKAVEIGRLGTAAAVADMAILGTADVVADLNTLGTADVVADLNTLGTADVVADMNTLAVTSVVNNMDTVATNVANVNTTAGSIGNVNTTAGSIANVNTVAGSIANVNTTAGSISNVNSVAGSIANVNTTASNLANVNNFANRYRIASSAPTSSLDEGDLYFDTSANELRVYNGSAWQGGVTATGNLAGTGANTFTGAQTLQGTNPKIIFSDTDNNPDFSIEANSGVLSFRDTTNNATRIEIGTSGVSVTGNVVVSGNVDGRDVAADGTKLDGIASGAIANVVEDTSPQLGGDLDVQSSKITTATSNGNVKIEPNGTGVVEVRGAGGNDGTLQLNCSAQSHGIKLKSPPHSAGQNYTLTFPSSLTANGVLTTDGSGTLSAGLLATANIADNAITMAKLANGALPTDITIGASNINTHAVVTNAIANDAVTNAKIADDSIDSEHYVDGSIDTAHLADDAVTQAKIAANAVNTTELATSSVQSDNIAGGAVTTAKINDGNVTTDKLANDAVTAAKLANTSVTAGSYGSATAIPAITVDAQGRITAASTNSVNTTTNLTTSTATGSVTVNSSTGTNATISEATSSAAGVMSTAHHDKLDGIESGATADQSANEILTAIKTVDGAGSGLDADTLDGISSASFLRSDTTDNFTAFTCSTTGVDDLINFTGASGSDSRGIAFNNRTALSADSSDGYLRLNQLSEFSNGVYTPGEFRADGGYKVGSTSVINSSAQLIASRLTGALPAIDGSALTGIAAAKGGGSDKIFWENGTNVTSNYTITNGYNAMSAGPITINSGVTVTIGAGETWTVV